MVNIGNDWDELLRDEFKRDYYIRLRQFLKREYATQIIHPDMYDIFNALKQTSYRDTKVVIFGQDPYHGANQAHGIAFSVQKGVPVPPSLQNIYKELQNELGLYIPNNGNLDKWTRQGVLLLNTVLTVRDGQANSHRDMGWERITDKITVLLNERADPIIFMLWGGNARQKRAIINNPAHIVLTAPHPSPMSARRGFFGCGHFKTANDILMRMGKMPIDWQIENI